jgi:hypothetical protein|tara:strand:- start:521 stop:883 length:363 start_codon:yes stop_codon:yes gene_type:complete
MTKRFEESEIKKIEPPFDRYVGDYIIITNINGRSKMGKLVGFSSGNVLLSPFLGMDYTPKMPTRKLMEDTEMVNMQSYDELEPTTRKNIERYCDHQNEEYQKDMEAKEKQRKNSSKKPNN